MSSDASTRERESGPRVLHRDDEYDSRGFAMLREMQARHFWYRGRHRFLLRAVDRLVGSDLRRGSPARVVDLGGGCGGWIGYLWRRGGYPLHEAALADSSETALALAEEALPPGVSRHRVDLMDLPWSDRWDVAFLLDVLEHIPDHRQALRQVHRSLAPGGTLFITVPALRRFWTWNDEFARHQRRYHRAELVDLGRECGYEPLDARYFMFLLSPLLLASRLASGRVARNLDEDRRRELAARMHRIPHPVVNEVLSAAFGLETPLGHVARFPWGGSLLAVLRKPSSEPQRARIAVAPSS
jgi:SAM-dependent methyltransferase